MPQVRRRHAHVRANGLSHQRVGAGVRWMRRQQRLYGRAYTIDDRAQVSRVIRARTQQLIDRGENRPALRMAEHNHQTCAVLFGGELDAAHLRRRHDVAGHAYNEQVAETLVENNLRRHT